MTLSYIIQIPLPTMVSLAHYVPCTPHPLVPTVAPCMAQVPLCMVVPLPTSVSTPVLHVPWVLRVSCSCGWWP